MPQPEVHKPLPERIPTKEKTWVDTLGTSIGDLARDIGTANTMAKEKFDGDTALMRAARGGMTALIGAGLEFAVDNAWNEAINNKGVLYAGRSQFNVGGVKTKLEKLQNSSNQIHVKAGHFIENATKDLVSGLAYSTMSYFSSHTLPAPESKHLLYSVLADAAEAVFTVGLKYEEKAGVSGMVGEREAVGSLKWQNDIRKYVKFGNPATILGIDWMIDGLGTFAGNIYKVRKTRSEKGGLPGKKVEMPQQESGRKNYYDRKPYEKREYGNKQPYNKDRVYYGKSQWNSPKVEEEVDLAKFE